MALNDFRLPPGLHTDIVTVICIQITVLSLCALNSFDKYAPYYTPYYVIERNNVIERMKKKTWNILISSFNMPLII